MDLDSSTHGGRLDPDALARGMRSGASGGMGPVGGSDCDEPLSPKAAPAKSLLSKVPAPTRSPAPLPLPSRSPALFSSLLLLSLLLFSL
eukprot:1307198-Rhodomonas_salina.1